MEDYKEIASNEWDEYSNKSIYPNDVEKLSTINYFKNKPGSKRFLHAGDYVFFEYNAHGEFQDGKNMVTHTLSIEINYLTDEWYLIIHYKPESTGKFYLCDQLYGLKKCLDNIFNI